VVEKSTLLLHVVAGCGSRVRWVVQITSFSSLVYFTLLSVLLLLLVFSQSNLLRVRLLSVCVELEYEVNYSVYLG